MRRVRQCLPFQQFLIVFSHCSQVGSTLSCSKSACHSFWSFLVVDEISGQWFSPDFSSTTLDLAGRTICRMGHPFVVDRCKKFLMKQVIASKIIHILQVGQSFNRHNMNSIKFSRKTLSSDKSPTNPDYNSVICTLIYITLHNLYIYIL